MKEEKSGDSKLKYVLKRLAFWGVVIACICLVSLYGITRLGVTEYTYETDKIEDGLDGFKIVQISDLHNANFGKNNSKLMSMIEEQHPDIIVITGDLFNTEGKKYKNSMNFVKQAVEICPVYYVTGNHELWMEKDDLDNVLRLLDEAGVIILNDESVIIEKDGAEFMLVGLDDASLDDGTLKSIIGDDKEHLKVVLAHEPQYLDNYAASGADLVLSGHAHGGQVRLPFVGALYAPDQGVLPEYSHGTYFEGDTELILSRGLGTSVLPVRFLCDPEIVTIELKCK